MYPGLFKLTASESFIWLFLHFLRNPRPFFFWRLGEENQCNHQGRQYERCQIDDEFHLLGYGMSSCVKPDDDAKIY